MTDSFATDGYAWRRALADARLVEELRAAVDSATGDDQPTTRGGARYAARNLLDSPGIDRFARGGLVQQAIGELTGAGAFPVRAILFDKLAEANWRVGWHQDLIIAVRERIDTPGFTAWSVKQGVPHVKPPSEVLREMVTLRLHLDDADHGNGPLLVLPGSHRWGEVEPAEVPERIAEQTQTECLAAVGDALFMRPLLMHASSKAAAPRRRRVLHIEFAAAPLPGGMRWSTEP
ncbi:Phytanoyl-CoA dioxygenase (PhyH) [Posidoniimonas corsicana]|uniref:Phytanoyl-CoA dioxygenase (PhyH) n=1 Tax=Posidoniimonas corsicana TaxID=1938618 RepID=A0A5C5VH34_9BACT|nr:phytanoyl-CoA dioxygenase family protein [Posidoniimonas corsicana]TWT37035.1 Phytanoyl-CoA dioxygenase (PhyH) [Posidoniimonas corsicana]